MRRCGTCASMVDKHTLDVHSASGKKLEEKTIKDCCLEFFCPVKENQRGCVRWKDVGNVLRMEDEVVEKGASDDRQS